MERKNWTLLVVAAGLGQPLQPVHLQKSLFLLAMTLTKQQGKGSDFYEFTAYDYGPFSAEVYSDAEDLSTDGLIAIEQPPYRSYRVYRATDAGRRRATDLESALEPNVVAYLHQLVGWVMSLTFRQLVSAIYREYPAMKANSVFRE